MKQYAAAINIIAGIYNFVTSLMTKFITISNYFFFIFLDKDEVYNNPNLHSEEQDELEIPEGILLKTQHFICMIYF